MTQEQISSTLKNWENLPTEQRIQAKADVLGALAKLDNLNELSPELKEQLNAGGVDIYAGGIFGETIKRLKDYFN